MESICQVVVDLNPEFVPIIQLYEHSLHAPIVTNMSNGYDESDDEGPHENVCVPCVCLC